MFNKKLLRIALILSGGAVVFYANQAVARQTIVIGSLGFGYDYLERTYDNQDDSGLLVDQNEGDKRDFTVGPRIELQSNGIHDALSLIYSPVLRYDDLYYSTDVDHYLSLAGERFLSKDWIISLANDYVLSSDPTRYGTPFNPFSPGGEDIASGGQDSQTPDEITQNLGNKRYWTNNFLVDTTYKYAEDSDAGLGYAYRVLRNDSEDDQNIVGYDEYDRHEFSGLLSRRFSPSWKTQLDLKYVNGLYDDSNDTGSPIVDASGIPLNLSQDLQEYWANLRVEYDRNVNNTFPLLYRYRDTQYEDLRKDIWVHELSFGWEHVFDSRNSLLISAGPSYVDAEDLDGDWGYNAYLLFTRTYQHGNVSALVDKRYAPRNFTGSFDAGLTDITDVRLDATYQFTKDISSTLFFLYRYEDILNPQGEYYLSALGDRDPLSVASVGDVTYSRDSYSAGASLDYTFLQWLVGTVSYVYYQQDGDLIRDSYDEHRVIVQLTASQELWRN